MIFLLIALFVDAAFAAWNFTIDSTYNYVAGSICAAAAAFMLVMIAKQP